MNMISGVEGCKATKTSMHNLVQLGWSSFFSNWYEAQETNAVPARVVGVRKNSFLLSDGESEWLATVAGKILHNDQATFPVVGDWVLVQDAVIKKVFPRVNTLSRGSSGGHGAKEEAAAKQEQSIGANLDTVFIVMGLDRDFNLRRLERYITLVYNNGQTPVVILTKADLQEYPEQFVGEVESVAFGVPVHLISKDDETGIAELHTYLSVGKTVAMIGSSGVGKSTLLNRIAGEEVCSTGAISERVNKGKHTTTSRDLILLPDCGMLIDNPGIREVALWGAGDGVESTFPEIEELAQQCRFSDCSHMNEPGCAVLRAVSAGDVSAERLASYHKMKRELSYFAERENKSADRIEKERWKEVALIMKAMKKERNNG